MDEGPSVGSEILPANFLGVMPQSAHLEFKMVKMGCKYHIVQKRSDLAFFKGKC